jgi:pyrroloquinoline quinone (PQQ) biosynthesis protein C
MAPSLTGSRRGETQKDSGLAQKQSASAILRAKIALFGCGTSAAAHSFFTHPHFPATYREYIFQSHSIIRASVPLMQAAEQACRLPQHAADPVLREFGAYLRHHIPEETGHHEWILDDGEAMGIERGEVLRRLPKDSAAQLVGRQYYWIQHYSPIALAGYIASMEGDPPTTEFVEEVAHRNGLPLKAFTSFLYHARIDRQHRQDLDRMLDSLPLSTDQSALMGLSAIRTMNQMTDILKDINEQGLTEVEKALG